MISCTTYRSLLPASLGLISTWWLLLTVVSSISRFRDGSVIFQGFVSTCHTGSPQR